MNAKDNFKMEDIQFRMAYLDSEGNSKNKLSKKVALIISHSGFKA